MLGPIQVRLARNLGWGAVAETSVRLISLVTVIYLTHAVSVHDFGAIALAQAAVGYVWLVGEFAGSSPHAMREIAAQRQRPDVLIVEFLASRVFAGCLLALLWIAGLLLLDVATEHRPALLSGALFFVCFPWYPDWILRGLERLKTLPAAALAVSGSFCGLTVLLTQARLPIWSVVVAWSMSYLVGGIVILKTAAPLLRSGIRSGFHVGSWRSHIAGSAAFAIAGALTLGLTQLPQVTLGVYGASPDEIGYLAAPLRVVALLVSGGQLLGLAAYPVLASIQDDRARLSEAESILQRTALVLGVGIAALGWPIAPAIVSFLFGAHFAPSLPVFQLLILVTPVWFAVQVLEFMVLARGGERRRVASFMVAGAVLIAGLVWAARIGTAVAVTQAMCLALVAAAASLTIAYVRSKPRGIVDVRVWRTFLAGLLTTGLLQTLPSPLLAAAAALPIFALALLGTHSVTREDMMTFRRLYARV